MPRRPNVLVIQTDEQATWTLGAYGGLIPTPNLDRLAREGATCDKAFTTSAVCTPSRGCFLTGRYPHCHGAVTNNDPLHADEVTWAELLRRQGWRTSYIGKWHLDGDRRPGWVVPERGFGFSDTRLMFNRGHWKKMEMQKGIEDPVVHPYEVIGDERTYTTDWLVDRCIETIDGFADGDAPFCLMCSIPDPHTPFSVREPYASRFRAEDMPLPASLHEDNRPSWAQNGRYTRPGAEKAIRRDKAVYLGMVACIDDNLGRLFAHLEAKGLMDETLIVFTTDHGEYLGEHGLLGKNTMYRSAYHLPLLWRLPGTIPAGLRLDQHLSSVDILPTLCGLLDVPTARREQGRDASAFLRGQDGFWRDEVHQHHGNHHLVGLIAGPWHLILHEGGEHRLFRPDEDPEEIHDHLATEADVVRDLAGRILAHHEDLGSPSASWLRPVVGSLRGARDPWPMANSPRACSAQPG